MVNVEFEGLTQAVVRLGALVEMAGLPLDNPSLLTGICDSLYQHIDDVDLGTCARFRANGEAILAARKDIPNRSTFQDGESAGQRTKRLADLGGIVKLCGLADFDEPFLLGLFANLASKWPKVPEAKQSRYAERGKQILDARGAEKRAWRADQSKGALA